MKFNLFFPSADDEVQDAGNFVYRFHLDPSKGWFSTSVFDVKGVFMRALKTQEKTIINSHLRPKQSPKKVQIRRVIDSSVEETNNTVSMHVTDSILVSIFSL